MWIVAERWEMFHVKQQGEYVWVDEVSGGGVMAVVGVLVERSTRNAV
jgi:hypothetical protein